MQDLIGDASKNRIFALMIDNLLALAIAVPIGARIPGVPASMRWLLVSLIYLGYFVLTEAMWSRTIGKKLFGLKIIRMNGEPLDWESAIVRSVFRVVEVNPLLFAALPGALVVTFSKRKQRMGDLLAGTLVVREGVATSGLVDESLLEHDRFSINDLQDLPEPDMTPDNKYTPWKESE